MKCREILKVLTAGIAGVGVSLTGCAASRTTHSLKPAYPGQGKKATFEGKRLLVIHHAEADGPRKPQLYEIDDSGDKLVLGPRYYP